VKHNALKYFIAKSKVPNVERERVATPAHLTLENIESLGQEAEIQLKSSLKLVTEACSFLLMRSSCTLTDASMD
jgi:hypothetical protein